MRKEEINKCMCASIPLHPYTSITFLLGHGKVHYEGTMRGFEVFLNITP